MARLTYTPEMMSIGEEISTSHARAHGAIALAMIGESQKYVRIMERGLHAPLSKDKLAAYAALESAIENAFQKFDEELATALAAEKVRDDERAAKAREAELDAAEDARKITRAERLVARSAARGDEGRVSLCCPVCETGQHLNDGVCEVDGAYAFDLREPEQDRMTRIRYAPWRSKTPATEVPPAAETAPEIVSEESPEIPQGDVAGQHRIFVRGQNGLGE